MLVGMHHPWRDLRSLTDWTLVMAELPDGVLGRTDWSTRTITLNIRMLQAQRRSTVCHEIEHVRRGPAHPDPVLTAREESAVEQATARKMITIEALGEAMAWSDDIHEVAEDLWVDPALVETRLRHLHPSERHYLRRRLTHKDHDHE